MLCTRTLVLLHHSTYIRRVVSCCKCRKLRALRRSVYEQQAESYFSKMILIHRQYCRVLCPYRIVSKRVLVIFICFFLSFFSSLLSSITVRWAYCAVGTILMLALGETWWMDGFECNWCVSALLVDEWVVECWVSKYLPYIGTEVQHRTGTPRGEGKGEKV